ncbi:aminotransferase class I/II-fold pyridoxal phosphate-dependent enzyme [Amycolatopsis thermoflava]|uniref:aminotransferase class I/II-fold pyridoxal phosphate-dependent enzyme n=1 Tax=Amycolatopsis thermoflava TaxID=84480 RepID=UPI0036544CC7
MDHAQAPVIEAIQRYRERGHLGFIPPGHKQGRGVDPRLAEVVGRDVFASDIILMNGLDDRRMSQGVLAKAEELMADAVDAEEAYFSTCGSSLSVKSAMLAVAGPGDELLVSRNAHKSVLAGLIISGVRPVWVHPRWDGRFHLAHPPGPEDVRDAFAAHPGAKGMLLITPTDYGGCAAIRETARVCHDHDVPLIVDEAWGAHFPFHPDLPSWAMDADADMCVTSVHKMGCGLEQGSVFHLRGDRIDPQALASRADLLGTTSPSALIFAGLDGWRRQMVQHGEELLGRALELAASVRAELAAIPGSASWSGRTWSGRGWPTTTIRSRSCWTSRSWTGPATTRANGCASTTGSTWDCPTTGGWPRRSRSPTTRRPRGGCSPRSATWPTAPARSVPPNRSTCPSPANWSWSRRCCRATRSSVPPRTCRRRRRSGACARR